VSILQFAMAKLIIFVSKRMVFVLNYSVIIGVLQHVF